MKNDFCEHNVSPCIICDDERSGPYGLTDEEYRDLYEASKGVEDAGEIELMTQNGKRVFVVFHEGIDREIVPLESLGLKMNKHFDENEKLEVFVKIEDIVSFGGLPTSLSDCEKGSLK